MTQKKTNNDAINLFEDVNEAKKNIFENLKNENHLPHTASFSCFVDGVFVYSFRDGDVEVELAMVADDFFLDEETFEDLLDKKGIIYVRHSAYLYGGGQREKVYQIEAKQKSVE